MMFNEARIMEVLSAPVVSEKATMLAEKGNTVVFKVLPNANKKEIKNPSGASRFPTAPWTGNPEVWDPADGQRTPSACSLPLSRPRP